LREGVVGRDCEKEVFDDADTVVYAFQVGCGTVNP